MPVNYYYYYYYGDCCILIRLAPYESTGRPTVNNLSYPKIHDSSHSSDGLVLSEVEGAHGKVSSAVVGSGEGHVQAGHLVDLTWVGQCKVVLQSTIPAACTLSTLAMGSTCVQQKYDWSCMERLDSTSEHVGLWHGCV